jgi:transglutaminase-like putative cysteine protease
MKPAATLWPRWPGWKHLPREARDTLFLLAVIGWTVMPHLSHLPAWCGLLCGIVMLWRGRIALANAPLPSRWLVVAVVIAASALTVMTEHTLLGKEAGVTMLVLLMVLKTLELRARRDALVIFFLGFFLVLTNFLYSQTLLVAAAMLVSVWGLLTALVLAHMPVGQPTIRQAGGLAARAALLGAPVMVVLFLLFPRIGPLWGLPQDAGAKTGLSGELRMGNIAELATDESIAFRLRFDGEVPPAQAMYFRGPVLERFDGVEWRQRDPFAQGFPPPAAELRPQGAPTGYEMTLEPSRLALLPLLDATPDTAQAAPRIEGVRAMQWPDLHWVTDRPLNDRLRFHVLAWTHFEHGPRRGEMALRSDLELPPGYNPRTLAWAAQLRQDPRYANASPDVLAGAVLQHIRNGGFTYTLAPGEYGTHAVDEFWLDRRRGFCEHFAASFVVVMRALDVPARIVTGYQGTDLAPADGYWVVRQSHAHAWAEYWQPGRGWVRADPTAAVAPDRVERSRHLAPRPGIVAQALGSWSPELLTQMRKGWEAINNRWNQWVLGYSQKQQLGLLERLGVQSPNWEDLSLMLIGLLSTGALLGAGWAWWDRHRQDPWQRLMGRVRERLTALGIEARPHEPPRTLAAAVRRRLGEPGHALAEQLEALDRLRYGHGAVAKPQPAWWRGFAAEAARLRRLASG